jgi:hypothetical protein
LAAKALFEKSAGKTHRKKAEGKQRDGGIVARARCGVKRKGYKILWSGCGREASRRLAGRPRSTKIFVDNTKLFVVAFAHETGTPAKANGV